MNRTFKVACVVVVLFSGISGVTEAQQGPPPGKGPGGEGPPGQGGNGGETETGGNNLSFPVVFSDNVRPSSYVDIAYENWIFADLTGLAVTSATVCAQETNTTVPVPESILCYYGRKRVTVDDQVEFVGDPKVWWLQERVENRWQAFDPVHPSLTTPLIMTAIDWGDLLESSPNLNTRQVRTEVSLLFDARTDTEFTPFIASAFDATGTCDLLTSPDGCFAAFNMSGAVPGTDQSIDEVQGTDYPGPQPLTDPTSVKTDSVSGQGFHATVYSGCARLIIQRLLKTPPVVTWDSSLGYWTGDAAAPELQLATYANPAYGSYTPEVNAGGTLLYGYNWNAKTASTGTYRLTFVLDGAPRCPVTLNTEFDATTYVANPGEQAGAVVVSKQALDSLLGGDGSEGGLTYLDVTLAAKGGGRRP